MTAAEIRAINPLNGRNYGLEKLTIELAAQVSELNENFHRFLDRVDAFLSSNEREMKKERAVVKHSPPPPENESIKKGA